MVLATCHLDHDPQNNTADNLAALCQRCHLLHDAPEHLRRRAVTVRVTTHLAGGGVAAGAGNIIAGGIIGVGVDAYNGANLDHSPNPVDVTLQPIPEAAAVKRKGAPVN